ncbi:glutamine--tRNA ligase/YqeY domain fusion protein [Flexilinea flocculi]|uniref:Glutamine--tRNA ligase n=1 Tax=Flexilinea flocculi TaxID=1678840 RepID=A0A0S7BUW6_9CHLR|nr:glutamine--tRNA ligase/YqeY domain fusion protein [Flexilinea flocculi]GAP41550.1 glutaminyl-tRNA synthetase [Flexilinea flocculi]
MNQDEDKSIDFIREAINEDLKSGRFTNIHTRFPPEPNGYLHIGHAKALTISFGIAEEYGGKCNLRFDDTNPTKENIEFVNSIKEDIHWLGFDWEDREFFASSYFDKLYEWAIRLVKKGKAYVDDQSQEDVKENRGTLTEPGKESPFRNRSVEENLDLLNRMKNGEFPDGSRVLRAKIDMASPNMNMRDPVMYRIIHEPSHHRTGNKWCIYPMYDWAHGQNDSMEGITHSLCDLAYENHRPLYEWFLDELGEYKPRQIEFARLNLSYTVLSKRKLLRLVKEGIVKGWDDPRMPTLCGLRRRGYTPEAIKDFIKRVGIAKNFSIIDIALLESAIRDDLNQHSLRRMAVLKPLKVIIDNYPDQQVEELDAENNPGDPEAGTRKIPFSKVIYIDQDDFRETPPPKYYRLFPGNEVRLRYAYYIKCTDIVKNSNGEVIEVHCTYDPDSYGGKSNDGRKVKATIHWLSEAYAKKAEFRLYDRLFLEENPEDGEDGFLSCINPDSLTILNGYVEPCLAMVNSGEKFQFERVGFFAADPDTTAELPVFNRTVSLRDTWSKIEKLHQNQ